MAINPLDFLFNRKSADNTTFQETILRNASSSVVIFDVTSSLTTKTFDEMGSIIIPNTSSYAITASYVNNVIANVPFVKNTTITNETRIEEYESIFNPATLLIQNNNIFIVDANCDYYVLNNVINSGSLEVNGTMKIGGALLGDGIVVGTGILE